MRRAGGGASHDRRGRGSGARKARAAHSGAGEGASRVAMQARAWGLAWYLRDARFHRKPSCEIWPSGCTQAQRGVSSGGGSDGWLLPGMTHGRPGSEAMRPMPRWLGCVAGLWWQGCPPAAANGIVGCSTIRGVARAVPHRGHQLQSTLIAAARARSLPAKGDAALQHTAAFVAKGDAALQHTAAVAPPLLPDLFLKGTSSHKQPSRHKAIWFGARCADTAFGARCVHTAQNKLSWNAIRIGARPARCVHSAQNKPLWHQAIWFGAR